MNHFRIKLTQYHLINNRFRLTIGLLRQFVQVLINPLFSYPTPCSLTEQGSMVGNYFLLN